MFLDRDGVLVETLVRAGRAEAPVSLEEFRLVADAAAQVGRLREAGLVPIIFTNQPDVARGVIAEETLARMHARLRAAAPVEDIFLCPHDEADGCGCRKPKPGMLLAAAERWRIDLPSSYVVGDRWRDIDAGRAVGCYTILLERPYSACTTAHARVTDLRAAVDLILTRADD